MVIFRDLHSNPLQHRDLLEYSYLDCREDQGGGDAKEDNSGLDLHSILFVRILERWESDVETDARDLSLEKRYVSISYVLCFAIKAIVNVFLLLRRLKDRTKLFEVKFDVRGVNNQTARHTSVRLEGIDSASLASHAAGSVSYT